MSDSYLYILDEKGNHVIEHDVLKWGKWFESNDIKRIIDKTNVRQASVSTVFLGINHNFLEKGKPLLYETMVFGGRLDDLQWRYSTREEAITGHAAAVKLVRWGRLLCWIFRWIRRF